MLMVLKRRSGEEIQRGDHVLHLGASGRIELVATNPSGPELSWYVQEYGGGNMVLDAVVGRTFIHADGLGDYEDLEFVS
jgi:hypothetical protein